MKPQKRVTQQRKQEREFEVASCDLKSEFEDVIGDDLLDEEAYVELLLAEDE